MPDTENRVIRVTFDFAPEAYQDLEKMCERIGTTSKAEVVKNALSLYDIHLSGGGHPTSPKQPDLNQTREDYKPEDLQTLSLDFPLESYQKLEKLCERIGTDSKADVLRNALCRYATYLNKMG